MTIHELKIEYESAKLFFYNLKSFELIKNDKDYQVGDLIQFKVILPGTKLNDDESNKFNLIKKKIEKRIYRISFVFKNAKFGLNKDYCILSIKKNEQ